MKPAPFAYHRARTRAEVDALLAEFGGDAKLLAGGQSLIPILNMRLSAPAHLIDLNHLEDEPSEPSISNGSLRFGPLVRQSAVEHSGDVSKAVPLLSETIEFVAHPAIRNRGTVVGSIAHSDPAAELPAVLTVLDGEIVARSAASERVVKATDFFAGPLENSLEPEEWVVEVRFPVARPGEGFSFVEFARRSGDYALCGVASSATRRYGEEAALAVSYLGMGDVPARVELPVHDAEEIEGRALEDAVADVVETQLDAVDDIHATAAYRSHLAVRLGMRAVRRAWKRSARGEQ